jgi:D-tyrosyl-tRNA(Tyr) deacylase
LRVFQDEQGKMNRSVLEENGQILAISQFTLLADTSRGRRPSFIEAAGPEKGERLYLYFVDCIRKLNVPVETGVFGAMMDVHLVNAGPVTVILNSKSKE